MTASLEPLVVPSSSIEQRRPSLGGRLMHAGLIGFLVSPAISFSLLLATPDEKPSAAMAVLVFALLLPAVVAPVVAIVGAILTTFSFPSALAGALRVEDAGLVIVRGSVETLVPRSSIEGGIVLPGSAARHRGTEVAIYLKDGRVLSAEVADGVTAHRLLGRLGIDPERRRVAVLVGSPYRPIFAGCASFFLSGVIWCIPLGILVALFPGGHWPVVLYGWLSILTVLVTMRLARPRQVVIGNDGIRVRGGLSERWIPYSSIRSFSEEARALFVEVGPPESPGERERIATGDPGVIEALASRIRMAMALGSNGAEGAPVGEKLDPADKPFSTWKEELRALVSNTGYRKAALGSEELLAVVEDPDLAPGKRLGAALALGIAGHPEARARIRIAADASADDAMRRALEEAAEGELGERALRRVIE